MSVLELIARRRTFLTRASVLGTAAVLGIDRPAAAQAPMETTTIRFFYDPVICVAPMFLAEELLRLEGFTQVEYVKRGMSETVPDALRTGRADFTATNAPSLMLALDAGQPLSVIAGMHVGCFELFANESIQAVRDLKGKRIAISATGSGEHVYIASMLAYVGMDPRKDVQWITAQTVPESMRLFIEGKADAFLGFPPQQLRRIHDGWLVSGKVRRDMGKLVPPSRKSLQERRSPRQLSAD